ncbi:MAG TPA: ABC transporter permease [Actinobacteria bacterium]|nr:ABC transporter permease [Actinomycetota bacterium]
MNGLPAALRRGLAPVVVPVLAVLTALAVAAVAVVVAGSSPIVAYGALFEGAFGTPARIATTIGRATPFIGTALAMAFAYKAGLFNIGAEGQILAGALLAAWVGTWSFLQDWSAWLLLPIVLGAGIVGGFVWGIVPGILKAKTGAHEVITTIMLNFVMTLLAVWLVNSLDPIILRDTAVSVARTRPLPDAARLPELVAGTKLHWGIFLMLGLVAATAWVLDRTPFGFEVRAVGTNADAATYAGMSVARITILVMAISGAMAGLAGAGHVSGADGHLSPGVFVNVGFDAIAIALLARANPYGIVPAALLWGALLSGAPLMQQRAGMSTDLVRIIEAAILVFIAGDVMIRRLFRLPEREEAPV